MTTSSVLTLTDAERGRIERIDHLVAIGTGGVAELIAALGDPSWTVRRAAVSAIAALGDDAFEPLCSWLRDHRTSEHAIAAAVDALSASTARTTASHLASLLDHADPAVVADAISIVGRRRATELGARIVTLLDDANDNLVLGAIEALGRFGGSAAVDALIAVVARRNFFQTFPAIQVLAGTKDPRVVTPLAELLDDELFAPAVLAALGRTGLPLAAPPLLARLSTQDLERSRLVATALDELLAAAGWSGIGAAITTALRESSSAGAVLRAALRDAERDERLAIVRLLGVLGEPTSLPLLVALLDDAQTRAAATEAIQDIVLLDEDALLGLLREGTTTTRLALLPVVRTARATRLVCDLLRDDEPEVRARACDALARIGDTSIVDALFVALADDNPRVAHAATGAIHSLGGERTRALAIEALAQGSPAVRRHAARIVAYLGIAEAFPAVAAAVEDPDRRLAELAVAALGVLEDPRCEPMLVELARHAEAPIRAAAIRAASHRSGDAMGQLLGDALADDAPWVRYYACQGLARQGRVAAIPALVERLGDAGPHVRVAAIEALTVLDTPLGWQALASAARSPDPDERRAALVGIGQTPTPLALPLLLDAAASDDVATRLVALAGLARSPDPAALEAIAAAALGDDAPLREAAVSLLGERTDTAAIGVLLDLALVSDVGHPAHLALSRFSPARLAALAERLEVADDRSAPILAAALARMQHPLAIAALERSLAAPSPAARRTAATLLVTLGSKDARTAVHRLATSDPDPEVRRACLAALEVS